MATYAQVLAKIKEALTGRTVGTLVQVDKHEEAEIAILDYIEAAKSSFSSSATRTAHNAAVAGVNCDLTWSTTFDDTEYDFSVTGYTPTGNPVEYVFISKAANKIVIKPLVNGTISALAFPRL